MRNYTFIAIICSTLCQAQNFPFPDSGAVWVQTYSMMTTPPPLPEFTVQAVANIGVNGEDTLINGTAYVKVVDLVTGVYYGALRDVDGTVWHVAVDSLQEHVLYDFNVQAGEVIENVIFYAGFPANWTMPSLQDVQVSQVSTWPQYGERKVIDLSGGIWVEGIGNLWGLFTEPWPNVSNYQLILECMSHLDTIRSHYLDPQLIGTAGTCAPISMGIESGNESSMAIYPNPATDLVRIDGTSSDQVMVMDASGRQSLMPISPQGTIDVSSLTAGPYTLHLQQNGTKIIRRFMKL
jgi:hypothetical protein